MPHGQVYLLRNGDRNEFKVGCVRGEGRTATDRLRQLLTGNPHLRLLDTFDTDEPDHWESLFHKQNGTRKITRGTKDWFTDQFDRISQTFKDLGKLAERHAAAKSLVSDFEQAEPDQILKEPTDAARGAVERLRQLREQKASLEAQEGLAVFEVKQLIGTSLGFEDLVTWGMQTKKDLDRDALKRDHRDIYDQYLVVSRFRSLRLK